MESIQKRKNLARVGDIVKKVFTVYMRDELFNHTKPENLQTVINSISKKELQKSFRKDEIVTIKKAITKGSYEDLDVSILHTILRNLIPHTNQSGPLYPDVSQFQKDIDKIKSIRNEYAHLTKDGIELIEYEDIIGESEDMCKRMDKRLKTDKFEKILKEIKTGDVLITYEDSFDSGVILQEISKKEYIVESWRDEESTFHETSGCKYVEKCMKKEQIVTIVGPSGIGKTAISQHVALKFKESWKIIPVSDFKQFVCLVNPRRPYVQLYVLQDPFGKEYVEESIYLEWKRIEGDIASFLKCKQIKLLITCREKILEDDKCPQLLQNCVISIHEKFPLTKDEKLGILTKHFSSASQLPINEKESIMNTNRYFPLLCCLFGRNKEYQKRGSIFFTKPATVLQDEIVFLYNHDKIKYYGLVLLLFSDGFLKCDFTDLKETVFQEICRLCCIYPQNSKERFYKALLSLPDFVIIVGDVFMFRHDFIADSTLFFFGSDFPEYLVRFCPLSILRKSALSVNCYASHGENEFAIILRKEHVHLLAERYFDEFQTHFIDICNSPTFRDPLIQEIFTQKLESLSNSEFQELFLSVSPMEFIFADIFQLSKRMINWAGDLDLICNEFKQQNAIGAYRGLLSQEKEKIVQKVKKMMETSDEEVQIFDENEDIIIDIGDIEKTEDIIDPANLRHLSFWTSVLDFDNVKKLSKIVSKFIHIVKLISDQIPEFYTKLENFGLQMLKILFGKEGLDFLLPDGFRWDEIGINCIGKLFDHCDDGEIKALFTIALQNFDYKKALNFAFELRRFFFNILNILTPNSRKVFKSILSEMLNFVILVCTNIASNNMETKKEVEKISSEILNILQKLASSKFFIQERKLLCDLAKSSLIKTEKIKQALSLCSADLSPLLYCFVHGYFKIVHTVLRRLESKEKYQIPKTLFLASCINGSVPITERIMQILGKGAMSEIWFCKDGAFNALHIAAALHYPALTSFLLKNNFPINAVDWNGNTPLHLAVKSFCGGMNSSCMERGFETIKILLSHGSNILVPDCNDVNVVQSAIECITDATIFDFILMRSRHANMIKIYESSNLILASKCGNLTAVSKLLDCNTKTINETHQIDLQADSPLYNVHIYEEDTWRTAVMYASANGHNDVLKLLFSEMFDVTDSDKKYNTALLVAAENGQHESVKLLCEFGVSVHYTNTNKESPLFLAASNGYLSILNILMGFDANINQQNVRGQTPLMIASFKNHINIIERLLDENAKINLQDDLGMSALCFAAWHKNENIAELLLEKKSDVQLRNQEGLTPFLVASKAGRIKTVALLLDYQCDINDCNKTGDNALILAAREGHYKMVCFLLERLSNVSQTNYNQETAFWVASANGHEHIVRLLLEKDIDINQCDYDGKTPLFIAAENGHLDIVECLLESDANVDKCKMDSTTPLMIASEKGHCRIVETLIMHNSCVNTKNNIGRTALWFSACGGNIETLKLLLKHYADKNVPDQNRETPIMKAISNNHVKVIAELLRLGVSFRMILIYSISPISTADVAQIYKHKIMWMPTFCNYVIIHGPYSNILKDTCNGDLLPLYGLQKTKENRWIKEGYSFFKAVYAQLHNIANHNDTLFSRLYRINSIRDSVCNQLEKHAEHYLKRLSFEENALHPKIYYERITNLREDDVWDKCLSECILQATANEFEFSLRIFIDNEHSVRIIEPDLCKVSSNTYINIVYDPVQYHYDSTEVKERRYDFCKYIFNNVEYV